MADNYLEKRYEEVFGSGKRVVKKGCGVSLDSLLLRNRSHRGYDKSQAVTMDQLRTIVGVNDKIPSARNQQVLRFRLVTRENGGAALQKLTKLGSALPELHLPFPGTEPEAFIVICTTVPESKYVDIDLGISLQSMLLKAVEIGLNGIAIGAFDKDAVKELLSLPLDPALLVAIGKGSEKIQLTRISPEESHAYYRKEGIHYVPKIHLDDLLI
ncbi:MAG: nitroreductase family protein [Bacteroidales bacterium]|nr:nitroreductase family protein [Bacteroidales bacterium]